MRSFLLKYTRMLTHLNQRCLLYTTQIPECGRVPRYASFLQPWHLTFIFPGNSRTNGAGRVEMISPSRSFIWADGFVSWSSKHCGPLGDPVQRRGAEIISGTWGYGSKSDRISFAKSGVCLITAKKYPWCDLTFLRAISSPVSCTLLSLSCSW